jgi:hypothetical protein
LQVAVAGSGTKQLLIRAAGPALSQFGVAGVLVDPKLEVFGAAGARLGENDNWPPALGATFAQVGAFALPAASRDAAPGAVRSSAESQLGDCCDVEPTSARRSVVDGFKRSPDVGGDQPKATRKGALM